MSAKKFLAGELLFIMDPGIDPSVEGFPGFYVYPDCQNQEEANTQHVDKIFCQTSVHDVTPVVFLSYIPGSSSLDLCRIIVSEIGKVGCIDEFYLYRNHEHDSPRRI